MPTEPLTLTLARFAYEPDVTLGVLSCPAIEFECFTLERPWLFNTQGRSCIPEGTYPAEVGQHHGKNGPTPSIELRDVPNRTQIEIHAANTASELLGCIAVGRTLGFLKNQRAVLQSRATLDKLLRRLEVYTPSDHPNLPGILSHRLFKVVITADPFRYRFPRHEIGTFSPEEPYGAA